MNQEPNTTIEEQEKIESIDEMPTVGAKLPHDDYKVVEPEEEDIIQEVRSMDAFRDYERERRGNSLTFGDY